MGRSYKTEDFESNILYVNPGLYYLFKKSDEQIISIDRNNYSHAVWYFPLRVNGANGEVRPATSDEVTEFSTEVSRQLTSYVNDSAISSGNFGDLYSIFCGICPEQAENIPHKVCDYCGKKYLKGKSISGINLCYDCYNENSATCDICHTTFFKPNGEIDREGYYLCSSCGKREFILGYHHHYPKIKFYGKSTEANPQPYLGVELEVGTGGQYDNEVKKILPIINKNFLFAYCSRDSSIDRGFEIITQPATLQYHNSIKHVYKQLFDTLIEDGYTSHDNMTCGLHVHFNRDFYSDDEKLYATNLIYLVDKWWDNILKISRRNKTRLDYCQKINSTPENYYRRANKYGSDHRIALNIGNENTIEFRMFRGTLNVDTFMATLQFVNNCILAAKNSFEDVQNMKFEDIITGRTLKNYWKLHSQLGTEL